MSPTVRILLLIILVTFIAYRVWSRWQGAKAVSEGDEAARLAWKEGFQALQQDPRFLELKTYTESQVTLTMDVPTDDRYQLVYATVMDEKGSNFALQDIDQGTFLIIYMKGKQGRKQFALNLKDHSTSTNDLGVFAFQAVVPPWAG
mgnify:CR=1 FL=1